MNEYQLHRAGCEAGQGREAGASSSICMAARSATRRKIGAFVEIQKNAKVGTRCKISSHTFICEGVTIEDNVFVGHGVVFINDMLSRATTLEGETADREGLEGRADSDQKGRFDRLRGDNSRQCHDRRERDRRRW